MTATTGTAPAAADVLASAREIAGGVAAAHAADVDRNSRFPGEAVAALRASRLLGAGAPVASGGLGCSVPDLVSIAGILATGCSSTAMTWAMHQIQIACLVRHGNNDYLRRYTERVAAEQLLLASATSEVGIGGDIRTSHAAVTPLAGGLTVAKDASTVSYGAHCDGILATLRRAPDAAPNDQVMVLLHRDETALEQLSDWNALGMRGTCSAGFRLRSTICADQILPEPFEKIMVATMVPYSHLLWAACWLGIAQAAAGRAREFLRARERKSPGSAGTGAAQLAHAYARLQMAGALISDAAHAVDSGGFESAGRWTTALSLNNVKVAVSEIAIEVTREALTTCGFAGYQEIGRFSVARHLRDVLSAPLMISNERLLSTNGGLLLSRKESPRPW
jgi:acyl-CoA dehydrogenase